MLCVCVCVFACMRVIVVCVCVHASACYMCVCVHAGVHVVLTSSVCLNVQHIQHKASCMKEVISNLLWLPLNCFAILYVYTVVSG